MSKPTITAVGTATRWVPADHVDLSFTITRRAANSAQASVAAGAAYAELAGVLAAHGDTVVERHVSAISVRVVQRFDQGRNEWVEDGFEASRTESVRLSPVNAAGNVLRAVVVGVHDVTMGGPWFGIDADHPAHAEVRAAAAARAREVANQYAAGLDLRAAKVLRLGPPFSGDHLSEGSAMLYAAKGGGGSDDAAPLVELTDEDVEVSATIEVEMTLE